MEKSAKNKRFIVFSFLALFGVIYNSLIDWSDKRGLEGLTSAQVAIGVAVTLLGASQIIGRKNAQLVLACFVASGTPNILGHIRRYKARQQLNGNL